MVLEEEVLPFFQWLFGGESNSGAFFSFLSVTIVLAILGILLGYLLTVVRHGPIEAFYMVAKAVFGVGPDLVCISPRRIFAIARLAIQESIRLRVFVVFGVFVVIMLFGGWFLNVKSTNPARIYLEFVFTSASYLSLMLALFLSAFSIPNDIKNKTIYTVVTKPVRAGEIVLGRIVGFCTVGTVFLVVICLLSYIFVIRGMAHSHNLAYSDMVDIAANEELSEEQNLSLGKMGKTSFNSHHRHQQVKVDVHGRGRTNVEMAHWHRVQASFDMRGRWEFSFLGDGNGSKNVQIQFSGNNRRRPRGKLLVEGAAGSSNLKKISLDYAKFSCEMPGSIAERNESGRLEALLRLPVEGKTELLSMNGTILWSDNSETQFTANQTHASSPGELVNYEVGPAEGAFVSRVPHYGKMRFIENTGRPGEGISVGDEWSYRKYIEGATLSAAVWTFKGIEASRFNERLPIEMTLSVWRSHKGDIEKAVQGTLILKHPSRNIKSDPIRFYSQEFKTQQLTIGRSLLGTGPAGLPLEIDLFDDLVEDGQIEIWLQCYERGQFFGAAQADLYLREANTPFYWNFIKGYISLWLQMTLVTCFGVMFSTFLSGAVAMMATITSIAVGCFSDFIVAVALSVVGAADSPDAVDGGGPLESAIRVMTQKNLSQDLEIGELGVKLIYYFDLFLMYLMTQISQAMPNFTDFVTSEYVANGYNIHGDILATHCAITLGFFLVLSIVNHFIPKDFFEDIRDYLFELVFQSQGFCLFRIEIVESNGMPPRTSIWIIAKVIPGFNAVYPCALCNLVRAKIFFDRDREIYLPHCRFGIEQQRRFSS